MRIRKEAAEQFDRAEYIPGYSVKHISVADTVPVYINESPGVLDDLNLTEARQKMDAAHNKIIKAKYDLAIWKAMPGVMQINNPRPDKSPFDEIRERATTPQPATVSAADIQAAIDATSIRDPEYREAAKAYLSEVLPVITTETNRLIAEYNEAQEELARITKEYQKRVTAAAEALEKLNNGIIDEFRKFETANNCKSTEGHTYTSRNCRPLVLVTSTDYGKKYQLLEFIQKEIERLEAEKAKGADIEASKNLERVNSAAKFIETPK